MKKSLFAIAIGLMVLTGCTGVKTTSTGIENEAFIELIGNPNTYVGGVIVNIDDKITFNAEVNKAHADRPKGKVYAISTGIHTITVSYNNSVIFKKQVFVSAQETKRIVLP